MRDTPPHDYVRITVMKYSLNPKSFVVPITFGGIAWLVSGSFVLGISIFIVFILPAMINLYVPYAKDNPKHLWFKRKVYGWGWVPITWEGWLVVALYIILVVLFSLTIDETSRSSEIMFTFALPVALLTITLIRICYKKGEKPKWQWGIDRTKK